MSVDPSRPDGLGGASSCSHSRKRGRRDDLAWNPAIDPSLPILFGDPRLDPTWPSVSGATLSRPSHRLAQLHSGGASTSDVTDYHRSYGVGAGDLEAQERSQLGELRAGSVSGPACACECLGAQLLAGAPDWHALGLCSTFRRSPQELQPLPSPPLKHWLDVQQTLQLQPQPRPRLSPPLPLPEAPPLQPCRCQVRRAGTCRCHLRDRFRLGYLTFDHGSLLRQQSDAVDSGVRCFLHDSQHRDGGAGGPCDCAQLQEGRATAKAAAAAAAATIAATAVYAGTGLHNPQSSAALHASPAASSPSPSPCGAAADDSLATGAEGPSPEGRPSPQAAAPAPTQPLASFLPSTNSLSPSPFMGMTREQLLHPLQPWNMALISALASALQEQRAEVVEASSRTRGAAAAAPPGDDHRHPLQGGRVGDVLFPPNGDLDDLDMEGFDGGGSVFSDDAGEDECPCALSSPADESCESELLDGHNVCPRHGRPLPRGFPLAARALPAQKPPDPNS